MVRTQILSQVIRRADPWDLIVIGGGATGVGCALDAASRGFDVLLLEQSDFGKGTSSRSTKLVHGGVRYLEQGNISLVRQALRERWVLMQNAPHVVRRQVFIVPCYSLWQKIYFGIGLKVYDLFAGSRSFGRSKLLSRSETLRRLPAVRDSGLKGGVLYYDGQFDDSRLLTDMVTTSQKNGAAMLNYARVSSLIKKEDGRLTGVNFVDAIDNVSYSAQALAVINATGAFCDSIRAMSSARCSPILKLSRGIHLVFDRKFLRSEDAVMIPKTADGRVLFCIPWLGHLLVGTTETPVESAELEPKAMESEIEFVLETVGAYLDPQPTRADILSVFAGIRPLVDSAGTKATADLSRGHTIEIDNAGMLTITGGKWTTYREMAEEAVDRATEHVGLPRRKCMTATLAIESVPSCEDSGEPLHPHFPYTRSDVIHAVRAEMAQTLEDVLARRTRMLFLDAAAAAEMAPAVASIMAAELNKDDEWIETQIRDFNILAKQYLG